MYAVSFPRKGQDGVLESNSACTTVQLYILGQRTRIRLIQHIFIVFCFLPLLLPSHMF